MTEFPSSKIKRRHLERDAVVHIRQSTLRQVQQNTESTRRQYALQDRAIALGWRADQIRVIDDDLGKLGASARNRDGFRLPVASVAVGEVGMVLGLEVSRLARNNADWHRLLELASNSDTLILDETGVYDPSKLNDRILLGMLCTAPHNEEDFLPFSAGDGQKILFVMPSPGLFRVGFYAFGEDHWVQYVTSD